MFVTKDPVFSPPFLSFFLSLSYVTMNLSRPTFYFTLDDSPPLYLRASHLSLLSPPLRFAYPLIFFIFLPLASSVFIPLSFRSPHLFPSNCSTLPLFPHLWKCLRFYSRSLPVTPPLYDFLFLPLPLSSSENDFLQPACLDFLCLVFVSLSVLISFLPFPSFFFNQTKNSTLLSYVYPSFHLASLSHFLRHHFLLFIPLLPPPYTFHFLRGQRLWSCSDWILLPSHLNT